MGDDEIIVNVKNGKTTNSQKKKSRSSIKLAKEKQRKLVSILKVFFMILAVVIVIFLIFCTSIFNIKTIEVVGNARLSENKVISLSSLNLDTNIFKFNKNNIEKLLLENAYIENAKVSRKLPSTVLIEINERIPTYMLQFTDSYVYINNQGYMLEISNEKIDIPVLVGFKTDLNNIKVGNRLERSDLDKMNIVIKIFETAKNVELAEYITKIDISDTKEYKIVMEDLGKTIYLGDASDLNSKMLELKEILHKTQGKNGTVFLNVDLNTQRAYFRQDID